MEPDKGKYISFNFSGLVGYVDDLNGKQSFPYFHGRLFLKKYIFDTPFLRKERIMKHCDVP